MGYVAQTMPLSEIFRYPFGETYIISLYTKFDSTITRKWYQIDRPMYFTHIWGGTTKV